MPSPTTRNVSCVLAVFNSLWLVIGGIGIALWIDLQIDGQHSVLAILAEVWPMALFILCGIVLLGYYVAVADGRQVWGYPYVPWTATILYNFPIAVLMWWWAATAFFWTIVLALWATGSIIVAANVWKHDTARQS
jgi:hypothetical protein